jgi:uncharacterized membrane protein YczE
MPSYSEILRLAVPPSNVGWPQRIGRLAVAWFCVALGIALMIRSDVGVAPIDSLITGLSDTTGIDFGIMFILVSITFFTLGGLLGSFPGVASVTGSLFIGPGIDRFLSLIDETTSLPLRSLFFAVGLLLVGFGVCCAISTDLGAGPSEVVMLGLHKKGMPLVAARWLVDAFHLTGALIFSGPLGVGTILFLILMGPLIKQGLKLLKYTPAVTP